MNIQTLKEASDCLLNLAKPETQPIEHVLLQDAFERILAEDITAKIPVSKDLKEAAVIDGANILDIFKNVTWPSIAATCYSTILLMIIWTLNAFTFIYAMTEGGPAHKTEVMAMYIYKRAFMDYDFGMASAASAVLFVLSMSVSLVYLYLTREKEGK